MLTGPNLSKIQELIASASKEELIWLSGYLAGVAAQVPSAPGAAAVAAPPSVLPQQAPETAAKAAPRKVTIAYGTETGNSKKLATDFAARAKKSGINARLVGLEQYRLTDLAKEEYFLAVISTQGDGEPPLSAKKFYDHIHQGSLQLGQLKYGVLALGDTAYPLFCKAGEDVDLQFQKMGALRIVNLQKCDTDYEADASNWFEEVLKNLDNTSGQAGIPAPTRKTIGKKTYTGTILNNINLNDTGSSKETYHVEIAVEDAGYEPGDSIGIHPENPQSVVENILALSGLDPATRLSYRNEEITVQQVLKKKLNVVYLPERVVRKYAEIVGQEIPETRIGLLDLLKIYPVKGRAQFQQVLSILEPLAPRLYSISSSPAAHDGEIHVTVAKDTFVVNGEVKHGLCSDELSRLQPEDTLDFYIHKNSQFRLPAADKDIILIGPGTGIAPFRSFLAERDARGDSGKNWLFFGDQHFTTDFLYQTEIQNWVHTGVLTKVSTAFSRDQAEKVYVQHKMWKSAAELFQWLEAGAYVYICGAREPMSLDVENTLLGIIRQEGRKNETQAASYLEELKEAGRFLKDVY